MSSARFEPVIPAGELPQTHNLALDRAPGPALLLLLLLLLLLSLI